MASDSSMICRLVLAFSVGLVAISASADDPLPPPSQIVACSPSGKFCAASDPVRQVTLIISKPSDKVLWSIPGWHRWLFVSDNAESVVIGYDGMNFVDQDVSLNQPVIFFYDRGKLIRMIRLSDLYRSKSQLQRTASHLYWGYILGFNRTNQLVVELPDARRVAFNAKTGLTENLHP